MLAENVDLSGQLESVGETGTSETRVVELEVTGGDGRVVMLFYSRICYAASGAVRKSGTDWVSCCFLVLAFRFW